MLTLSEAQPFTNGRVTWQEGQGIALVTLTNPPANGYSHEMMCDLDEAILRSIRPESPRLGPRGRGERFFCAGADIEMLHETDPAFKYMFCLHANETLLRLERTPAPIAAIGGHCVGGGLESR